ncbi:hypothetical protein NIES4074_11300 [Cylindrospermum sp. NIES-4074]|nr:hypothetical protein NIES4074_11300 [Cylindrospermum sp. NIES-4074]
MFLSIEQIRDSLKYLEQVHPFFGVTFLVCKKAEMPLGYASQLSLDSQIKDFLDKYYKPCKESEFSYRCSRLSDGQHRWIKPEAYTVIILDSINKFSLLNQVFIHKIGTKAWGWKENYIESIKSRFCDGSLISIFHLAVLIVRQLFGKNL